MYPWFVPQNDFTQYIVSVGTNRIKHLLLRYWFDYKNGMSNISVIIGIDPARSYSKNAVK